MSLVILISWVLPGKSIASQPTLVAWGEVLFAEKKLSQNGKVSCQTCHDPKKAFTDGKKRGVDINGQPLHRNSPSLIGVASLEPLTWSNPVLRSLEQQVLVPLFLDTPGEMGLSKVWPMVKLDLQTHSPHKEFFTKAFPEAKQLEANHIVEAISAFLKTLIPEKTAYDHYLAGKVSAFSKVEDEGRKLFYSPRTHCANCHSGPVFTRASRPQKSLDPLDKRQIVGPWSAEILTSPFAQTGLYRYPPLTTLPTHAMGLYEFTQKIEDLGSFRIPSLRNVHLTAPYMHDGSLASLEEVIEHYNKGGKNQCFAAKADKDCVLTGRKSPFIKPLGLNKSEKNALISFLKTL